MGKHMLQEHEDKVVLHSMAKQVDYLTDRCERAEAFNNKLVVEIRKLCENTEVIKKELISIHNKLDPEAGKNPTKDDPNVMKADTQKIKKAQELIKKNVTKQTELVSNIKKSKESRHKVTWVGTSHCKALDKAKFHLNQELQ